MRRTVNYTKVIATAIGIVEGQPKAEILGELVYHGRKKSRASLEKHFDEKLKASGLDAIVLKEEEIQKTYEFSLEDLIAISTEVEEGQE